LIILLGAMTLDHPLWVALFQAIIYTATFGEIVVACLTVFHVPGLVKWHAAQEHGTVRAEKEMAARAEYAKRQAWLAQKRDALETRARTLRAAMEVEGLKWAPIQPPRMVSAAPPARAGL
jgi:hypothetical protein